MDETNAEHDLEFWRMSTVQQKVGLSRTEIYRRIKAGTFPGSCAYPGSPSKKFWVSTDVRAWQQRVLDDQFYGLFG